MKLKYFNSICNDKNADDVDGINDCDNDDDNNNNISNSNNKSKNNNLKLPIMIVVESVYSMDGKISPLREICGLAQRYNAIVIVDEAHSTVISFTHLNDGHDNNGSNNGASRSGCSRNANNDDNDNTITSTSSLIKQRNG